MGAFPVSAGRGEQIGFLIHGNGRSVEKDRRVPDQIIRNLPEDRKRLKITGRKILCRFPLNLLIAHRDQDLPTVWDDVLLALFTDVITPVQDGEVTASLTENMFCLSDRSAGA